MKVYYDSDADLNLIKQKEEVKSDTFTIEVYSLTSKIYMQLGKIEESFQIMYQLLEFLIFYISQYWSVLKNTHQRFC